MNTRSTLTPEPRSACLTPFLMHLRACLRKAVNWCVASAARRTTVTVELTSKKELAVCCSNADTMNARSRRGRAVSFAQLPVCFPKIGCTGLAVKPGTSAAVRLMACAKARAWARVIARAVTNGVPQTTTISAMATAKPRGPLRAGISGTIGPDPHPGALRARLQPTKPTASPGRSRTSSVGSTRGPKG